MPFAHLPPFDFARDFEARTFFRCNGLIYERGKAFDKDKAGQRVTRLLYESHKVFYANAEAAEAAEALAPVTIDELGGGWYSVNAPWLDAPEKIQGHDAADLRAHEIATAGEPTDHHGVAIVESGGGWYRVNAAWLAEPESVQGQDAAYARATDLREAGPPEGFDRDTGLVGSTAFNEAYSIGGEAVRLGDLVRSAQDGSGHDVAAWNALDASDRDQLIAAELKRQIDEAAAQDAGPASTSSNTADVAPGADGANGGPGAVAGTETVEGPTREARIQALVDAHGKPDLLKMAEGLDAKADNNKPEIAALIVDAGRDVKAGDGGAA